MFSIRHVVAELVEITVSPWPRSTHAASAQVRCSRGVGSFIARCTARPTPAVHGAVPQQCRTSSPTVAAPSACGWRARCSHSPQQSTTRRPADEAQFFRVTHPFHPLFGKEFPLVYRRLTWGEDRVYYHDETGQLRRLPASWTSISAPGVFETLSAGRSHFRIQDLLQLVQLIVRQREVQPLQGAKRSRKASSK
jgi:hypothetical protein